MELNTTCAKYIGFLRSLYLLHQNHHWLTNGSGFYGDHLLFERIYKSAQEDADLAAEKFIGLFGNDALMAKEQAKIIAEILDNYASETSLHENSLKAEKEFLKLSEEIYKEFKQNEEKMTLGLDDMLMQIASKREEAVYLLQQSLGKNMKTSKLNHLANKFKITLAQQANMGQTSQLRQKLNNALTLALANKNWGQVGFDQLYVTEQGGHIVVNCNFILPTNSAPFVDKMKYPQGLNQFKQEMMNLVNKVAENMGIENLTQIVRVNGK